MTKVICAVCNSSFNDTDLLSTHFLTAHPSEDKNNLKQGHLDIIQVVKSLNFTALKKRLTANFLYKCSKPKCKLKFPSESERDLHTKAHLEGSENSFGCFFCDSKVIKINKFCCCFFRSIIYS